MPTDPPATLAAWLRTRSDEQLGALLAARPDVARPAPSDVVAPGQPARGARCRWTARSTSWTPPPCRCSTSSCWRPTDGLPPEDARRPPCPTCPATSWTAALDDPDHRGRCSGATTSCTPPTRSAARCATRRGWAAARSTCGCSCPADLPAALAELAPTRSARSSSGWPATGRSATCPTAPTAGRLAGPPAAAARAAGPHRRAQRGAAPRDRPAPARRPPLRPAAAAARAASWSTRDRRSVDRQAAGAALESVGRVGEVLALLEEEPAGLLRSGGVGGARPEAAGQGAARGRARRRLAAGARATPPGCSTSAGRTATSGCPPAPTTSGASRTSPTAGRCWPPAGSTGVRLPSLVGQRDVAGKAVNPLSPDLVRHTAPAIRRSALTVLAEFPAGAGLAARRPGGPAALAHPAAGRPAGAGAGMLAEAARLGRRWSAACCRRRAAGC